MAGRNGLDVTVVIPTYNRAGLVCRMLNSVAGQNRPPARIVVVDDASTDGTPEVVRRWSEDRDVDVTVEVLRKNAGPAAARNRGIALATTEYVAFADSDDEQFPYTLARLAAPLESRPDAVLSFSDATVVSAGETQSRGLLAPRIDIGRDASPLTIGGLRVYEMRDPVGSFLKASIVPTSASCFRRSVALAVGGMPEGFRSGEDWLFWLRLSQEGAVLFQEEDLARHIRHESNLTHARSSEFIAREKLRGFLALEDGSIGVTLSAEHRRRVEQYRIQQVSAWRYQLSRLGLRQYLAGLQGEPGRRLGGVLWHLHSDPRSAVRALLFPVRGVE